jgi:hypothetical protein
LVAALIATALPPTMKVRVLSKMGIARLGRFRVHTAS